MDELTAGLLEPSFEVGGDEGGLTVVAESADRPAPRKLLGRVTSCVGREVELERLGSLLRACVDERASRAALLVGPAGSGKSRIRREALERFTSEHPGVSMWIARGDPISAGAPFGMLAAAVRALASLRAGEPAAVGRKKLHARVARHLSDEVASRVTEFLCEMCGLESEEPSVPLRAARQDATLMGDRIREAWLDLVAAECAAGPVVLALEDLHWGDAPSVTLTERALQRVEAPLFVLALARDEVQKRFPSVLASAKVETIPVAPLSAEAAARLAREVLTDSVDAATVQAIVARAEGNAFYLEELIRAAAADGGGDALPMTAVAMVQKRLESLGAEQRRILRAASVFGNAFWSAGVQHLLGGRAATPTLSDGLAGLVAAELVERRPHTRLVRQREFAFRHDLVRHAAYEMLTPADRRSGHRLAAEWLAGAGERDALVLAEHLDRGGDGPRAASWYRRAAEQALEGGDFGGSCDIAQRGLALAGGDEVRGGLELARAESLRWQGRFDEAGRAAQEATRLLAAASAPWFRAYDELIHACGRRADYGSVRRYGDAVAAASAVDRTAVDAQIAALCTASRQTFHAGHYEEGDRLCARIDALAASGVPPRVMAEIHRLHGARARHVGDLAGDIAGYTAALASFEAAEDWRGASNARASLGFACVEVGDLERARLHFEEALAQADHLGLETIATRARQNLGLVHGLEGDGVRARRLLEDAVEESRVQRNVRFEGWTRIYLSRVLLELGELEAAQAQARVAAEMLRVTAPARAGALASLARVLLAKGDVPAALAAAREAMTIVDAYGGIEEFESHVRAIGAEAEHAAGNTEEAHRAIASARTRLLARAAGILDPMIRARFLDAVPDNAAILRLAADWLGPLH